MAEPEMAEEESGAEPAGAVSAPVPHSPLAGARPEPAACRDRRPTGAEAKEEEEWVDLAPCDACDPGEPAAAHARRAAEGGGAACEAEEAPSSCEDAAGASRAPSLAAPAASPGPRAAPPPPEWCYLFLCSNVTQRGCESMRLLAAPGWELAAMRRFIRPGCQLFMINYESHHLFGPFVARGAPGLNVVPEAFGGKFPAQVLFEAPAQGRQSRGKTRRWISSGPKTAWEMQQLISSSLPLAGRCDDEHEWAELRGGCDGEDKLAELRQGCAEAAAPGAPSARACPAGAGDGQAGYVFQCSIRTQHTCERLRVLAAPYWELGRMAQRIRGDTPLFLYNYCSLELMGPFVACGKSASSIAPGAFGGKFSAHVRVAPLDGSLVFAAAWGQRKMVCGPLTPSETQEMMALLSRSRAVPEWGAAPHVEEDWHVVEGASLDEPVDAETTERPKSAATL